MDPIDQCVVLFFSLHQGQSHLSSSASSSLPPAGPVSATILPSRPHNIPRPSGRASHVSFVSRAVLIAATDAQLLPVCKPRKLPRLSCFSILLTCSVGPRNARSSPAPSAPCLSLHVGPRDGSLHLMSCIMCAHACNAWPSTLSHSRVFAAQLRSGHVRVGWAHA